MENANSVAAENGLLLSSRFVGVDSKFRFEVEALLKSGNPNRLRAMRNKKIKVECVDIFPFFSYRLK